MSSEIIQKEKGSKMDETKQPAITGLDVPDVLGDVRTLSESERLAYIDVALGRAKNVAETLPDGATLYAAFKPMLKFVVGTRYLAGCHDTSALFFMRLLHAGLSKHHVALCIGEVRGPGRPFDHSWVEVNGQVFDVAICAPGEIGGFAGGPVFGGLDLGSNADSKCKFGVASGYPLDNDAATVNRMSLRQYQGFQVSRGFTSMVELARTVYGLDGKALLAKYGNVKRKWRNPALNP
ncbi:TPA: hypothetical protein QDB45_001668 [Burkholderia vietnamiensis]|nr:hypothetical protein [Burkholderia vietnamiensis]